MQPQCWAAGAQHLPIGSGGDFSSHTNRQHGPAIQRNIVVCQILECMQGAAEGAANTSGCVPSGSTRLWRQEEEKLGGRAVMYLI